MRQFSPTSWDDRKQCPVLREKDRHSSITSQAPKIITEKKSPPSQPPPTYTQAPSPGTPQSCPLPNPKREKFPPGGPDATHSTSWQGGDEKQLQESEPQLRPPAQLHRSAVVPGATAGEGQREAGGQAAVTRTSPSPSRAGARVSARQALPSSSEGNHLHSARATSAQTSPLRGCLNPCGARGGVAARRGPRLWLEGKLRGTEASPGQAGLPQRGEGWGAARSTLNGSGGRRGWGPLR